MSRVTSVICLLIYELLVSCTYNDIGPKDNPPIAKIHIIEGLNQFTLDGSQSSDPDGDSLTYSWSISSNQIAIASPSSGKTSFIIPIVSQSFTTEVTLKVKDGIRTTRSTQTILVPAINQTETYGLGRELNKGVSNNTDYEWYFDQENSGVYAAVNCGPTSVTMAIKWASKNFTMTPLNARQMYRSTGGWWYTDDIINYLNHYKINNSVIPLTNIDSLRTIIDNGNVIILCLDMYYVDNQTDNTYHLGKFYQANTLGWGHFIVIKGYKEVDNQIFFEAYDPYSFGIKYSDGSIKGKDRYYKAGNLDLATNNWWDYAIIVSSSSLSSGRISAYPNAVDPSTIEHKPGQ